jgi:hypothetical protein
MLDAQVFLRPQRLPHRELGSDSLADIKDIMYIETVIIIIIIIIIIIMWRSMLHASVRVTCHLASTPVGEKIKSHETVAVRLEYQLLQLDVGGKKIQN